MAAGSMGGSAMSTRPRIPRSRLCGPPGDARSDDNAPVKPKMLYASSKDAIKKALTGINDEFQATECARWLISVAVCRAHGRGSCATHSFSAAY